MKNDGVGKYIYEIQTIKQQMNAIIESTMNDLISYVENYEEYEFEKQLDEMKENSVDDNQVLWEQFDKIITQNNIIASIAVVIIPLPISQVPFPLSPF